MEPQSPPNNFKLLTLGLSIVLFIIICFIALFYATKQINFSNLNLNLDNRSDSESYIVTKVVDGDTVEITHGGEVFKVRYIGIDTPETVKPNTSVQCYGKKASEFNKELVLNKKVRLEKDISDEDRYGRKLRYVYLEEGENSGKMVNEILVQEGYAKLDTFPPDIKYSEKFRTEESRARDSNKGLWNECMTFKVDTIINLYKYI